MNLGINGRSCSSDTVVWEMPVQSTGAVRLKSKTNHKDKDRGQERPRHMGLGVAGLGFFSGLALGHDRGSQPVS